MNHPQKITKTVVDRLPSPVEKQQVIFRDSVLPGFGVRVTRTGQKSFIIEKRVKGKTCRVTLGKYPQMTAELARKEASIRLGELTQGVNLNQTRRIERQRNDQERVTLGEVFDQYLLARKDLKPATIKGYGYIMKSSFSDWRDRPLLWITKDKVVQRHLDCGKRSHAQANYAMRLLRALFNFAMEQYETLEGECLIRENPVVRISRTRAWYTVKRRQTLIHAHQLPAWFDAVNGLTDTSHNAQSGIIRDYLLLILLTGLRRTEAATMKVSDVDLYRRTLTIQDPKNRERHELPLSEFLFDLLQRRLIETPNEYVFPGTGKAGHLVEAKRQVAHVIEQSGVTFALHDLRRTFATIAESLDIPAYALKRLLNHKMNNDVTAGYIVPDVERLRAPMEKITTFILRAANQPVVSNVVSIEEARQG